MNRKPGARIAALIAAGVVLAALAAAHPTPDTGAYETHAQLPHTVKSAADLFPPGR